MNQNKKEEIKIQDFWMAKMIPSDKDEECQVRNFDVIKRINYLSIYN